MITHDDARTRILRVLNVKTSINRMMLMQQCAARNHADEQAISNAMTELVTEGLVTRIQHGPLSLFTLSHGG